MKKIDINNKPITDKDILKHKDFGKVMSKVGKIKTPFYKKPFYGGGFIALAVLVTYLVFNANEEIDKTVLTNSSYLAAYESPINEKVEYQNIEGVIDPNNSFSFTTASGSKITIPANTLVDSLDNLISGPVIFKYREFLDQKDVFLSGIPMNYNSDGEDMNFESGGMFELLAYQKENPLFIATNKNVKVQLASKEVGDNFNQYYYSSDEQKWIYTEKDSSGYTKEEILEVENQLEKMPKSMTIGELKEENTNKSNSLKKLKNSKPIKPVLANKEKYSFTINVDYRDFPELKAFKNLKFEVSDKEKNFKAVYAKETWDDVNVYRGETRSEYSTCFTNTLRGKICFITNPVFAKKDFTNAEVSYDRLMDDYKAKKDSLKKRKKEIKKEIARRTKELNDQRIEELNRRFARSTNVVENRITRTFQIANFGVWNSDCPQKLPTEAIVKPLFVDGNNKALKFGTVFLVLKDRNEVISLAPGDVREGLKYSPKEECMLWCVTQDKRNVALFSSEKFKDIKETDKTYTFEMTLISSKVFETYSTETIFNL
jgi:hypothetical protein